MTTIHIFSFIPDMQSWFDEKTGECQLAGGVWDRTSRCWTVPNGDQHVFVFGQQGDKQILGLEFHEVKLHGTFNGRSYNLAELAMRLRRTNE